VDFPNFIGGSYESQALTADQERTVNLFFEPLESPGATSKSALYPTPGVSVIQTASTGAGRAHFFMHGRELLVIGTTFWELSSGGTLSSIGVVASDSNPATISSNGEAGQQIFVTSATNGYIYDTGTGAFSQVAFLNGKATIGKHLDGFFLTLDAVTSTFYISNLLDGTTWQSTQFAQRSLAPDPWVSMEVNGRYVWLLGELTSEVWYNAGTSPFPFAPHPSGLIPYGITAPRSVAVAEGTLIWLGASSSGDAFVLKASGFTPEVISDYPRQRIFNEYTTISDAQADVINYLGHTFYLLSFPTQDVTWAYDLQTGKWCEWGTWISEQNKYVAWRPRFHAMAFGEHRMLDASTGSVYRMAPDLTLDVDSRPIRRLRRAPALMRENERLFYQSFELDLEPGLGTESGQGVDPQIMLRLSNDGGKTWGAEMMRPAGRLGEYSRRVRWERLGAARRRVFEVSFSDPIPWRLTAAYLGLAQQPQQAMSA